MKDAKYNKLQQNMNQSEELKLVAENTKKTFYKTMSGRDQDFNVIKKTLEVSELQRAATKKGNMISNGKTYMKKCLSERIFALDADTSNPVVGYGAGKYS